MACSRQPKTPRWTTENAAISTQTTKSFMPVVVASADRWLSWRRMTPSATRMEMAQYCQKQKKTTALTARNFASGRPRWSGAQGRLAW